MHPKVLGHERYCWSKAGTKALLAIKICIENNRWPDFLDWGLAAA